MVRVVNCWMRGYQLSEEVLLEGVFMGNMRGGIRDTVGGRPYLAGARPNVQSFRSGI